MLLKWTLSHLSKIALKNDVRRICIVGAFCLNYFNLGIIWIEYSISAYSDSSRKVV